jgi:carbamoyl-phosphate synthase large subunit
MKTILITGIGGDIAQSIATIIKESRPNVRLIGTDVNLEHAGFVFVDKFFQVPMASSNSYLEQIRALIKAHAVDVIIPTNEQELSVFHPIMKELEDRCITAGEKIISIGIDKLKTINFIESLKLPVPWTFPAESTSFLEFPCIFKSKTGSGSKNIFIVENETDAAFFSSKFPGSIFQELLEPADQEVTCAVYRAKNGKVAVLQLLRKLTGGLTGWAKVINDSAVESMCKRIAKGMDLYGSFNIQLRITEDGPKVFEINPRFSSTVLMRHRLGFCDLLWALDEASGKEISFPDIAINQIMVRTQDVKKIDKSICK